MASETEIAAAAPGLCDALPEPGTPEARGRALGHRYAYPGCVGPNCSCWPGRLRLAEAALDAMPEGEIRP